MFHYIDPFLWQLVIVPTLTIGIGVAIALRLKRLSIAPLVTLIAYLGMEWFMYRGTLFFFTEFPSGKARSFRGGMRARQDAECE